MSSKCRTKGKITKKRPQRATSNVFAMFDQSQIQEFKEAFNMIDQNRDGFIDKEDLHDMLASLGKILLQFLLCLAFHYFSIELYMMQTGEDWSRLENCNATFHVIHLLLLKTC